MNGLLLWVVMVLFFWRFLDILYVIYFRIVLLGIEKVRVFSN